ncbi:MAG: OmpA family protein [Bacteroidota bacterium]
MLSIKRYIFGFDIFISYSRVDGSHYAAGLANILTRSKLTCFIDQWGTEPGEELPAGLKRTLSSSKLLILIGTSYAANSKSVQKELTLFLEQKRGIIIPIDFDVLERSPFFEKISGLARSNESIESLSSGLPSDEIVERIKNSVGYSSQNRRLRRIAIWTLFALLFMVCLITAGGFYLNNLNNNISDLNLKIVTSSNVLVEMKKNEKVILDSIKAAEQKNTLLIKQIQQGNLQLAEERTKLEIQKIKTIELVNEQLKELKLDAIRTNGITISTIFFRYGSFSLPQEFKVQLDKIIIFLKEHSEFTIEIEGYSFEIGEAEYNSKLSEKRAETISRYLISKGVSSDRITLKAYGENKLNPILVDDIDKKLEPKLYELKSIVKIVLLTKLR